MKCVVCKHGETKACETTMAIDRSNKVVVLRNIPAMVCETCGEEYVSSEVMKELEEARLQMFGRLAGKATIADDFDAPLPDEVLNDFESESASISLKCENQRATDVERQRIRCSQ